MDELDQHSALYHSYLVSIIGMIANLCKGRYKKAISLLNITQDHILSVLQSDQVSITLKNSYLRLYEVTFTDVHPYMPFQETPLSTFEYGV